MSAQWVKERLVEPSTWKGLSILGGALGMAIAPELWGAICTGVAGIWGAIETIRIEK